MILKAPIVSERHYPALHQVCEPGVVGESYADYLVILNEYRELCRFLGIPFEVTFINTETFTLWCEKKANWNDLLHYAGSTNLAGIDDLIERSRSATPASAEHHRSSTT